MPTKATRTSIESRFEWRWNPISLFCKPASLASIVCLLLLPGCFGDGTATSEGRLESSSRGEVPPKPLSHGVEKEWQFSAGQVEGSNTSASGSSAANLIRLSDRHSQLGVDHIYQNGANGAALISETIGAGCGWLDFDLDGRIDLYLNQAGSANPGENEPLDRLYRNTLRSSDVRFDDCTAPAQISEPGYSQGVAIADYNNDGFDDIYVTNLGTNTLWRNQGDGTFLNVSTQSATDDPRWGTSAAWGDLDGDGNLDLYVCNYCEYDPQNPFPCLDREGRPTVCNPAELAPQADAVFMNRGDGVFAETAEAIGLTGEGNRALGVAIADFTNDGASDIYVANDTTENFLFVNDGNGKFSDEATLRGCAVDRAGGPQGSMGVAVADVDGNGMLDIYCTHFFEESNTLYANFGDLGFRDKTAIAGLHAPTLDYLAFGTDFVDLNNDGLQELFIANGHVDHSERAADPNMSPQLFMQSGNQRWTDISSESGDYFSEKLMGRAVARADLDQDGDLDLAVANENTPANVLVNDSDQGNYLRVKLIGTTSNRSAIGSRVAVEYRGSLGVQRQVVSEVVGGSSFAASHEKTLHFGLGTTGGDVLVSIAWPSGIQQQLTITANQTYTAIEAQP